MPENTSNPTPTPTPDPVPAAVPAAEAPAVVAVPVAVAPLIAVGDLYIHNQSSAVYRIVEVGEAPAFDIVYQRFGDGFVAHLRLALFLNRLRPATSEESSMALRVETTLQTQRLTGTLDNVRRVAAQLPADPANPNVEVHAAPPPPRRRPNPVAGEQEPEVGILTETSERDDFERIFLAAEAKAEIEAGLRSIERRADLERIWNFSSVQPLSGRCIMSFYGSPGTGKTISARAIARKLGKKLYQVDYSQVISKYYGDTAKHIAAAFRKATEHQAVLFFDEADSLLSKRLDMSADGATTVNQNRNVLMQELDRFNGVVIMATNLFQNYDEAMLRRIARHVEFKPPSKEIRESIFRAHMPNMSRVRDVDFARVAEAALGLCGGDILNICIGAMEAASVDENPDNWYVTQPLLLEQIRKVRESKEAHRRDGAHTGRKAIKVPADWVQGIKEVVKDNTPNG